MFFGDLETKYDALFSPPNKFGVSKYRYLLTRIWNPENRDYLLPWIMCNPSYGDATMDDPTILQCMRFARRDGYSGIVIGNVHAHISHDPRTLSSEKDPFGPDNREHLTAIIQNAKRLSIPVICAWGIIGTPGAKRSRLIDMLKSEGVPLKCLGYTQEIYPRHPLYVKKTTPFVDYVV